MKLNLSILENLRYFALVKPGTALRQHKSRLLKSDNFIGILRNHRFFICLICAFILYKLYILCLGHVCRSWILQLCRIIFMVENKLEIFLQRCREKSSREPLNNRAFSPLSYHHLWLDCSINFPKQPDLSQTRLRECWTHSYLFVSGI